MTGIAVRDHRHLNFSDLMSADRAMYSAHLVRECRVMVDADDEDPT